MKLTEHKTLSMFTRYNGVDQADAKDAMEMREGHYAKEGGSSAASTKKGLRGISQPFDLIGSPSRTRTYNPASGGINSRHLLLKKPTDAPLLDLAFQPHCLRTIFHFF